MDHRKTWLKEEMCHKKWWKNCEKCEILAYLKNYPKPKFTSKINDFRGKREFFQTNSSHDAKHSPSSSPLCRPLAGFGAFRYYIFCSLWPYTFDRYTSQIKKALEVHQNFIRALIWLNISSNGPREDSNWKGNVS